MAPSEADDAGDLQPWYKDGLAFSCTRCGQCCTGAPGFVYVNDEEITAIAEFLGEPRGEVYELYTRAASRSRSLREKGGGDCVFYQAGVGCTIYAVRPRQCRTWPFWESNLHTPGDWEKTRRVCPGSGQGDLISAEEITRRMKVIRV
jgi:Fe-S-cluster containining protein